MTLTLPSAEPSACEPDASTIVASETLTSTSVSEQFERRRRARAIAGFVDANAVNAARDVGIFDDAAARRERACDTRSEQKDARIRKGRRTIGTLDGDLDDPGIFARLRERGRTEPGKEQCRGKTSGNSTAHVRQHRLPLCHLCL